MCQGGSEHSSDQLDKRGKDQEKSGSSDNGDSH